MCRATAMLRRTLGIHGYRPTPHPPALVRRPTRFGARARANGIVRLGGFGAESPVIARLVREHRLIRELAARGRGQDG